ELELDLAQLLEAGMVLGARDRQHDERPAESRQAEGVELHPRARVGELLVVSGELVPVRELAVLPELETEVLLRRRDLLRGERRCEQGGEAQGQEGRYRAPGEPARRWAAVKPRRRAGRHTSEHGFMPPIGSFHGNRILTYRIPGAPARAVELARDTLHGIQPGAVPGTLSGAVPPPPSSALNGRRL